MGEETEFQQHVEALASKRLEKPKKLSVRNGRFWSEILSQHYNFDRDSVEVEFLRKVKKSDLVMFYNTYIRASDGRKKLTCQVVSTLAQTDIVNGEPANTEGVEKT